MNFAWVVWLVIAIVLGIVEATTVNLVSIWFALGALSAMITALITPSIPVQLLVFAVVAALLLAFTRSLRNKLSKKLVPTNADSNIGRRAVVILAASATASARVHLDGVDWNAKCELPLVVGEECVVTQIQGNTLFVKPAKQTEPFAAVR